MDNLSSYILTYNSEKYLEKILCQLEKVSDEIIILDSGSSDKTKEISIQNSKVKFHTKIFDDFKSQRNYAASLCTNDMIYFLDSDEIPDNEFIENVLRLKKEGFKSQAYKIYREWYVLNKKINSLYPITSPDFPIRIFDKTVVSFAKGSNLVHETLEGYDDFDYISGKILHYTFHNKEELYEKLDRYTTLASRDLLNKHRNLSLIKVTFSPIAAFLKWYFVKNGYKDGKVGFILGKYAYDYTKQKYIKARKLSSAGAY